MNADFGPFHTPVPTPKYRGLPWWGLVTDRLDDPGRDWLPSDAPPWTPPGPVVTTAIGIVRETRSAA